MQCQRLRTKDYMQPATGRGTKKGTPGEGAAAICNRAAWARSRKRFHVRRTETRVMVPIFEAWTLFTSPYVRYLSNVLGDYSVMTHVTRRSLVPSHYIPMK